MTEVIAMGDESVVLASSSLFARVSPQHGCRIDQLWGKSLPKWLWERPAPPQQVRALPSDLGPSGHKSIASFDSIFVGGWFPMLPTAGLPGQLEGRVSWLHGEACRLPWVVESVFANSITARLRLQTSPLEVRRRISIEGRSVSVFTAIENLSEAALLYTFGEHPCFSRDLFAGARLDISASRAVALGPLTPHRAQLRVNDDFTWPHAPLRAGGHMNLSQVPPLPVGAQDHVCLTLKSGVLRIQTPKSLCINLKFDLEQFPFLLLWLCTGKAGEADVFALEPMSSWGWSPDHAVASGTTRVLNSRETQDYRVTMTVTGSYIDEQDSL